MRQVKKILIVFVGSVIALWAGLHYMGQELKADGGLSSLSRALEAYKLKSKHPGIPPAELQKRSAKAPSGVVGLMQSLSTANTMTDSTEVGSEPEAIPEKEVLIEVAKNPQALTERQTAPEASADSAPLKGEIEATTPPGGTVIQLRNTADGREVVAVLENKFGNDKDIQRIMSLNIPDDLRLKILDNYKKTGVLPKILVKEKQSGSTRAPAGDDDPYNKKNW